MAGQPGAKVLLTTLTEKISARGNVYLSGWLGKARVVGFRGEDEQGHPTWNLYLSEPEPRANVAPSAQHDVLPVGKVRLAERLGWAARAPVASIEQQRQTERANKAAYDAQQRHQEAMQSLNDEIPE
jgi:hypothetical protein